MTLDFITDHYKDAMIPLDEFTKDIWDSPHIFFTHTSFDINRFYDYNSRKIDFINKLFDNSKIIYVHRDGRDVMTSLYYYGKKYMPDVFNLSFSDFIRMENNFDLNSYEGSLNRVEYWKYHVESWLKNQEIMHVSFEDYKNNYENTINRTAKYLELERPKRITKMTRKAPSLFLTKSNYLQKLYNSFNYRFSKKKYQPYYFRKGTSGDYVNHFCDEDYSFFYGITKGLMRELGYITH
jgi:hypothetical protein